MGMFDDLMPGAPAGAGMFDDLPAAKPSGAIRKLADKGLGFASGAVGATKAIADAAGAGNAVSDALGSAGEFVNDYLSPEAKADQQEQAAIMAGASGKGIWEGVKAGAKAFGVAPVQTAVQGLGSIVPVLVGGLAGLPGAAATGIAMGAGTAKGAIYDRIKKEGGTEEQATQAQEYSGANTDQIALGGALGAADALTGVSRIAGGMVKNALGQPIKQAATNAVEQGVLRKAGMGMLGEMPLEAAQGGQEQVAANLAAQRAGYQAGTWDNVASNATLEALASAGPGAAFGALERGPIASLAPPPAAEQPVIKPSEAMGLNPAAGPMQAAAAVAVDSGANQPVSLADRAAQAKATVSQARANWEISRDENDLSALVEAERLNKQVMLAQMQVEQTKQAQIDELYAAKPVNDALARAGELNAPTAMQQAMAAAQKQPEAAPAADMGNPITEQAEPRIVERTDGMTPMPRELAELQVEIDGGEVVRTQNRNGKYAYHVIKEAPAPKAATPAEPVDAEKRNKEGNPFTNLFAANIAAKRAGPDWEPVQIGKNQFVARRKDANGPTNPNESTAGVSAPVQPTDAAGTVATGSVANAGPTADTLRANADDVVPATGLPGGSADAALSYDQFKGQMQGLLTEAFKYTPNQAGSSVFAEKMAVLSDKYPDYSAQLDQEANEQNPQAPAIAAPTKAPGKAPQAVAGNAATATGIPAKDAGTLEGRGINDEIDAEETRIGLEVDSADAESLSEFLRTDTDPATGKPIHSQGRRNELMADLENLESSVANAKDFLKNNTPTASVGGNIATPSPSWDMLTPDAKTAVLKRAGWVTKAGDLNIVGKNLLKKPWADITEGTRATIQKNSQPKESTNEPTPTQAVQAKEEGSQAPAERVANNGAPEGWTDAAILTARQWDESDRGQRSFIAEKAGLAKRKYGASGRLLSSFNWADMPQDAQRDLVLKRLEKQAPAAAGVANPETFKNRMLAMVHKKKFQPSGRVIKVGDRFAVVDRTDAQQANDQLAAKRRLKAARAAAYDKNPLMTFMATHGLFHAKDAPRSQKKEFSPDSNIMVSGYGPVFKSTGKQPSDLVVQAIEEGYLPQDGTAKQLEEFIRRAIAGEKISPMYAEGVAEQVMQDRLDGQPQFEDFLDSDIDPFGDLDYSEADAQVAGYNELEDPIKAEVNALLAQAESLGIDTEEIRLDASYATANESEQAYFEAARDALQTAIAESNRSGSANDGAQGDAGNQEGLTAPTQAEVLAQQERTENAQALDDKAQIDAEASRQTLTAQTAPEQRTDTSGDMFGEDKAALESAKKEADAVAKNEAKKDPNQTGMFDEPAPDALAEPAFTYIKGDRAEYTGKTETISGGLFHEVKFTEGTKKGQTTVTQRAPDGTGLPDNAPKPTGIVTPQIVPAKPAAPDPQRQIIELRKRESVLKSLRACLGA